MCLSEPTIPKVKDPAPPPPPPIETADRIEQPASTRSTTEQKRRGRASLRIGREPSGINTAGTAAGAKY